MRVSGATQIACYHFLSAATYIVKGSLLWTLHRLLGKKQKRHSNMSTAFFSGDGGNRTRVRKIRPLHIYKLSQPISLSSLRPRPAGSRWRLADGPRKGRLPSPIGVGKAHVDIYDIRHSSGQQTTEADAVPLLGTYRSTLAYAARGRALNATFPLALKGSLPDLRDEKHTRLAVQDQPSPSKPVIPRRLLV